MNNPINDIPVWKQTAPIRAVDAFEVWLQGRMNLCVQGLMDRITRLEEQNTELKDALAKSVDANEDSAESKFDDQITEWIDKNNLLEYIDADHIFDTIESQVENCVADKVTEVIESFDIKLSVR